MAISSERVRGLLVAAVVAFLPAWARAQAVQGGPVDPDEREGGGVLVPAATIQPSKVASLEIFGCPRDPSARGRAGQRFSELAGAGDS